MKTYYNLIIFVLSLLLLSACEQNYIDGISKVDPGADESAPQIKVNFPPEGYELQTNDAVASINFDFEVRDDIEIASISLKVDGTEITSYSTFKDYRVAMEKYMYDNVITGSHVFSVVATDIDGKTTTKNVNFTKAPPYVPQYDGEIFYMPFNNEFKDMVSLSDATVVGSPGFGTGIQGGPGYLGAANSYLTFPSAALATGDEFSASFWLKIDASDTRAGILSISPATPTGPSDKPSGFGFIRENSGANQKFLLLVGNGTNASWFNPGDPATIDPTVRNGWIHFAISISASEVAFYMDGVQVSQGAFTGIDWTGVGDLSIMSGDPNFSGWNHKVEKGGMDELRLFNKALTQEEVQTIMLKEQASFYMDFDGDYEEALSGDEATAVGTPGFAFGGGISGDAYQGATDSYLTFPSAGLATGSEFSASFWLKIDATDTRAGILAIAPASPTSPSDKPSGFGFIRENSGTNQKFLLLVGNGTNASWFNPGDPATIDPTVQTGWIHFAISIAATEAAFYMDGVQVSQGAFTGIDWTDVGDLSIMSGDPNFSGWNHKTERGQMDDLYLFHKALTPAEVTLLRNTGL
ncbi:LamG domain-containing protein [Gaoshiqia sediminis]|uniref:LamG domain-containing protein n=1 Tax=Gaoshiqia sediminis TaxID=2986998 RepID=A0AA41YDW7_9BACT|nr:LamG domain-containing protein [Gaoshiqia sediminis]MCW0483747.1 LamG domain-containing protein [Gaoshiqia sediminis]